MTLNLMSLATVKVYLGLTDTTYDASITAMLPIVSADVRRILNHQFDTYFAASFDETADTMTLSCYNYTSGCEISDNYQTKPVLPLGTVVQHANLPDDTYITDFAYSTGTYTLSGTPTDAGAYVYKTLNISQWPTVSAMIKYRIDSISSTVCNDDVKSKSMMGVSVTYRDINKQYNYPQKLINDLGAPYARVG